MQNVFFSWMQKSDGESEAWEETKAALALERVSQEGLVPERSPAVVQSTPVSCQTLQSPESLGVVAMDISEDEGEDVSSTVQPPLNPNVKEFLEVRKDVGESMETLPAPLGCSGLKDVFRLRFVRINAMSESGCRCRCRFWLLSSD